MDHLKDKIKLKKTPDLDPLADKLSRYKIDVGASYVQQAIAKVKTVAQTLSSTDILSPTRTLNTVFPLGAPDDKIHILVELPEGESIDSKACGVVPLSLLCCSP